MSVRKNQSKFQNTAFSLIGHSNFGLILGTDMKMHAKVLLERLVLQAILGEGRARQEIQNLCLRFVILKVRNPLVLF